MIYEREYENPNYKFLSYDLDNINWHIHFHESFEVCYVKGGEINITINNIKYNLKAGDSVIIFSRQLHKYETPEVSNLRIITFMPELVSEFINEYKNMIPESNYVSGIILPCAVDAQIQRKNENKQLSARYVLEGIDYKNNKCKIFIENNAYEENGKVVMSPVFITDSPALKWIENAKISGDMYSTEDCLNICFYTIDE